MLDLLSASDESFGALELVGSAILVESILALEPGRLASRVHGLFCSIARS